MADASSAVRRLGQVAGSRIARRRSTPTVEDSRMTLVEHLKELRRRLLIALIAVGVATLFVGIWGYHEVFDILKRPYCEIPATKRYGGGNCQLIFTHPTDAFFVRLKVSLIAGVLLACPIWLYQLWAFITPGLHRNERRWGVAFVLSSIVLFATGSIISYLVLSPALDVLAGLAGNDAKPLFEIKQYISFVTSMLVIFGASFEFPLVLILLNLAGIVSSARLRSWRRGAIFLMFVFAGFATPTQDPFSMLALALPLCLLYEIAVAVARWTDKRRARRDEESEFAGLADDEASPLSVVHDESDYRAGDLPPPDADRSAAAGRGRSTARVGGADWDDEVT
jgi:sec-independent protein translocase protein TatC